MGQGTSEAVARVEETRARLDAEVAELQRRVPPMVDKAKHTAMATAAALGGGVVLVLGVRMVLARRRRRRTPDIPALLRLLPDGADAALTKAAARAERAAKGAGGRVVSGAEVAGHKARTAVERLAS
jgi:hypothetical protein